MDDSKEETGSNGLDQVANVNSLQLEGGKSAGDTAGGKPSSADKPPSDPVVRETLLSEAAEDGLSSKAEEEEEGRPVNLHINSTMEQDLPPRRDSIGSAQDLVAGGLGAPEKGKGDETDGTKGLDEVDWDKLSQFSLYMRSDARYYFQHPYARLIIASLVTVFNFLIYAEDPVAHSQSECYIPVVGQAFSFVCNKYPPGGWSVLKVFLWLTGLVVGLVIGKLVVHKLLLNRLAKLRMFANDMGSFMVMFLTSVLSLYVFSWLYNAFLLAGGDATLPYHLNSEMGFTNATFMRVAGCGTWLGDFVTLWMVLDMMLQDRLYPQWAQPVRKWWKGKPFRRIILFWSVLLGATFIVVLVISTDWIQWDKLNRNILPTNELSRAFLASFILVMDLFIIMQDWDFPHFVSAIDVKLPGLNTAHIKITIPKFLKRLDKITIHITGKWFNYGIIFLVMILDLNMWKNQIFYAPYDYGQYSHPDNAHIYSVQDASQLVDTNTTALSYEWRSNNTNPATGLPFVDEDLFIFAKYYGYPLSLKAIAFVPSLSAIVVFIALIFLYGRKKPTKKDPYAGRLMRRPKKQKGAGSGPLTMVGVVRAKVWGGRKVKNGNVAKARFSNGAAAGDTEAANRDSAGVTGISFTKTDGEGVVSI